MGKPKVCPKCGKEVKDSKTQRLEKALCVKSLKGIHVAGIDILEKETEGYCYDCWKIEMRHLMKPFAEQLGQNAEKW
jgi:hypothetical protein